jgi:hypothetical protein
MAESWKEACWKAEQEAAEYRDTIVPALMMRLRIAERERDAANRMLMRLEEEMEFTRDFIRNHGLEFALASEWTKRKEAGSDGSPGLGCQTGP